MATFGYPERYVGSGLSPARSVASIVAIIAALLSFYLSSQNNWMWGLIAAIVAIAAGALGSVKALSPHVRGGILSIAAVVLGVIAIIVALLAMIF